MRPRARRGLARDPLAAARPDDARRVLLEILRDAVAWDEETARAVRAFEARSR